MFEPMFTNEFFRAVTDDREREVRDIVRVRNLVRDARPERQESGKPHVQGEADDCRRRDVVTLVVVAADLRSAARDPAQAGTRRRILRARAARRPRLAARVEVAARVGADGRVLRGGPLFPQR